VGRTDGRRARKEAESEFAGLSDDETSPLLITHDPADDRPSAEPLDVDRSAAGVGGRPGWDDDTT